MNNVAKRNWLRGSSLAVALLVGGAGCASMPQHPVEGCPHPVEYTYNRIEDFRDGLAMEFGQARVEDDTTEMRLDIAKHHVAEKTEPVRSRLHSFLYGPKPRWLP